jgi:nucleoside 2-deoxyribosyltransferase
VKIYLASRYGRRVELCGYRDKLESLGHVVTSRWLTGDHTIGGSDSPPDGDNGEMSEEAIKNRQRFAEEDAEDVSACDLLIAFTEPENSPYSRGGRHVELGMAYGLLREVMVVGHRENIFCWLPDIHFARSFSEALAMPVLADCQP